ncbi:conserved hypothetical protein [Crenothrix polyspora]|uniref:Uncharacterized protein n=1 Tax=Crenothrix polyspora TaxID=360316 RepID=A0A1R4GZY9_9GAMM|nr:hypothetical protein [Crenothrix polyspora]SJM89541.1 conserved hypothetical protein [Crenothrix polyspora]
MITNYWVNRQKSKFLTTQIRGAERQIVIRQDRIGACTTTLIEKLHQQMTAPTTLWLAGSFGFILGELTRRQSKKVSGTPGATNKSRAAQTSPIITALKLLTSIQTLYTALPIAWMLRTFHKSRTSPKSSKRQSSPVTTDSSSETIGNSNAPASAVPQKKRSHSG